ncbi:hypothetical protein F5Y16DRAFT_77372 [Xylariaceae sp. FL0255]|nr:hypothetical protein F5Y16DRAFT_77372 [Xylariaceae sp. FL0255]
MFLLHLLILISPSRKQSHRCCFNIVMRQGGSHHWMERREGHCCQDETCPRLGRPGKCRLKDRGSSETFSNNDEERMHGVAPAKVTGGHISQTAYWLVYLSLAFTGGQVRDRLSGVRNEERPPHECRRSGSSTGRVIPRYILYGQFERLEKQRIEGVGSEARTRHIET